MSNSINDKKIKKYLKILKENNLKSGFYQCAYELLALKEIKDDTEDFETLYDSTICVISPILISFVTWILKKAQSNDVKKLYFLSRDGQIMYKIAKVLVAKYHIPIELHYLFCSRISLRLPLYYVNRAEAMDKLFLNGAYVTMQSILDRLQLTFEEKKIVLESSGIDMEESYKQLTTIGIINFRKKIENNKNFNDLVQKKSEMSYEVLMKYLEQEGLCDNQIKFAIVDSGWVGSMQRSIRILLDSHNTKIKFEGYYFGLFGNQKKEDGSYYGFYFSNKKGMLRSVFFNNNLFECICSADHGMTIGYNNNESGKITPKLKEHIGDNKLYLQQELILKFAENLDYNYNSIYENDIIKWIRKLIKCFMAFPSNKELQYYGNIKFCDDTTENYMMILAPKLSLNEMKYHLIPMKIYFRIFYKGHSKKIQESFWMWGTIRKLSKQYQLIFSINYFTWQVFQWFRRRNK